MGGSKVEGYGFYNSRKTAKNRRAADSHVEVSLTLRSKKKKSVNLKNRSPHPIFGMIKKQPKKS